MNGKGTVGLAALMLIAAGCCFACSEQPTNDGGSSTSSSGTVTTSGVGGASGGSGPVGGSGGSTGGSDAGFTFFVVGDSRTNSSIFETNLRSIYNIDPQAVAIFNTGDITAKGTQAQWDVHHQTLALAAPDPTVPEDASGIVRQSRFRTDVTDWGPYIRYIAAVGNHDAIDADWHTNWNDYLPGQKGLGVNSASGVYFSLSYEDTFFIVLDSENPSDAQTMWLEQELMSQQSQQARWRLVLFHHPVYPCNKKWPFKGGLPWVELLEQHNVDIAFVSHSHTYERTCPMKGGSCASGGVRYVNSSGAGAQVRALVDDKATAVTYGNITHSYDCKEVLEKGKGYWHHFCHVAVSGCKLTISCYPHDHHASSEAAFDTFVVDKCDS